MASIEQVWRYIIKSPGAWPKIVVGTCLSIIPVVHLFALGYIYRFTMRIRQGYPIELPEWENWRGLFIDGLKFFVLQLVWLGIPILIGQFIYMIVGVLSGSFGKLALMMSIPVGVFLVGASLYRFQAFESFKDALDLPMIMRMFMSTCKFGLLLLLATCGVVWIVGKLAILLIFTLSLVIFAYFTSLFRALGKGFI